MEIPELIIALDLKMKIKEEDIAEKRRKLDMEEYDLKNHKKEIKNIVKELNVKE